MAGQSARTVRTSRTGLLLWFVPPFLELVAVLMLIAGFEEVAREAVLGSPGSEAVLTAVLAVLVVGVGAAWRGVTSVVLRALVGGALFVSAGLLAVLLVGFLTGGAYIIVAVLLAHAVLSVSMIGGAVMRSTTAPRGRQV